MAVPAIIWRNPKSIWRRRLWNRVRKGGSWSIYVVVRSGERDSEWEGMPDLEILEGGRQKAATRRPVRNLKSGA